MLDDRPFFLNICYAYLFVFLAFLILGRNFPTLY